MALIAGTDTNKRFTQDKMLKVIAHAWGREKGFHKIMIEKHCSRRGDLDRIKRVDVGVPVDPEKRAMYKMKHDDITKATKKRKLEEQSHELLAPQIVDRYGVSAHPASPLVAFIRILLCLK